MNGSLESICLLASFQKIGVGLAGRLWRVLPYGQRIFEQLCVRHETIHMRASFNRA